MQNHSREHDNSTDTFKLAASPQFRGGSKTGLDSPQNNSPTRESDKIGVKNEEMARNYQEK